MTSPREHPVAATTAGGSALAVLTVWLLGRFGISLSAEEGTVLAGAVGTIAALVGRDGILGIWHRILHGSR